MLAHGFWKQIYFAKVNPKTCVSIKCSLSFQFSGPPFIDPNGKCHNVWEAFHTLWRESRYSFISLVIRRWQVFCLLWGFADWGTGNEACYDLVSSNNKCTHFSPYHQDNSNRQYAEFTNTIETRNLLLCVAAFKYGKCLRQMYKYTFKIQVTYAKLVTTQFVQQIIYLNGHT